MDSATTSKPQRGESCRIGVIALVRELVATDREALESRQSWQDRGMIGGNAG